jgi:UDP-N-acetylglucosamine--N-acetylmuramyl-(pentapeptide) pyrophosphoryl-undecaprenol N-acetylglucosamine transferase
MSGPVVIAAGGTGGHMFPALALARALQERGRAVALITDRRGARFVKPGLPLHLVAAGSPTGSLASRLLGLGRLATGLVQSLLLFRRLRPTAAACFGGYASVPPALAAAAVGRPLLLHEQNAVLGRANRLVARFAARVALSFADTAHVGRAAAVTVTGNPVRPEFGVQAAPYTAPQGDAPIHLLVLGGSQGARVLSDVLPAAVALLPDALRRRLRICQQCRPEDLERVRAAYAALAVACELATFFADVPERMAAAHLIVSRAGASSVAEILTVARPALLIPYAHAADDHQRANAARLAAAGAAELLVESDLSPASLAERLAACLSDPARLAEMAARARGLACPDAARRLADLVLELAPAEGRS